MEFTVSWYPRISPVRTSAFHTFPLAVQSLCFPCRVHALMTACINIWLDTSMPPCLYQFPNGGKNVSAPVHQVLRWGLSCFTG